MLAGGRMHKFNKTIVVSLNLMVSPHRPKRVQRVRWEKRVQVEVELKPTTRDR
jgi:hypothetical protein